MIFQRSVENPSHKIFVIVHNTPSLNNITKLTNLYKFKDDAEISFQRSIFSIVKEMLLEFQRIIVDLYSPSDKFLQIITSDTKIGEKTFEWNEENCKYQNFAKTIENMNLMKEMEKETMLNIMNKNLKESISFIGKATSKQLKFVELCYNYLLNLNKEKNPVRWWKETPMNMLNDRNDSNFSFFNNMGTIILIVHNFNEEDIKNVYECVNDGILEHKEKVHGVHKLKNIHFKLINIVDEEKPLFKKYYIDDSESKIRFDRYDIHFNEDSKTTIGFILCEVFNLGSFTMTNIPMKDESNSKLNLSVEMYHPQVDLPFLSIKKFQESMKTIALTLEEYECYKMFTNIKTNNNLITYTAAWNSTPKRTPLLAQSLPFTVSDFSSREGSCANGFILGGKDIFPELLLEDLPLKGSELAFSLSKNIDNSKGQICIIDEALYESKNVNESGGKNLADKKIMVKMLDFIDSCTSNIEKTDRPGLIIDNDLKKGRLINPMENLLLSVESKDCFRSELNKIIKILSRVDSVDCTYAYLKALIEIKERTIDEMKCILDVISNFKFVSRYHENLFKGFCYYYFKKHISSTNLPKHNKFNKKKEFKRKVAIRPTYRNVIEKFLKRFRDTKPEFAGWVNEENEGKSVVQLYNNSNKFKIERRVPFQSKYIALDNDQILLAEYSRWTQPLSDNYLRIAPPPYFGGGIDPTAYDKQRIEYRDYVERITSGNLIKEIEVEIERKCERLRINYNEPLPPLVLSTVQRPDSRKRRFISDSFNRIQRIKRRYSVQSNIRVNLTKKECQTAEKLYKEYRQSLKNRKIDVDDYASKIKSIENELKKKRKNDKSS
uniref:Protein asunder n=1 Tax=Strongyloides stercoralis TaxID=6248 RepID=A0A0K0EB74_STRER